MASARPDPPARHRCQSEAHRGHRHGQRGPLVFRPHAERTIAAWPDAGAFHTRVFHRFVASTVFNCRLRGHRRVIPAPVATQGAPGLRRTQAFRLDDFSQQPHVVAIATCNASAGDKQRPGELAPGWLGPEEHHLGFEFPGLPGGALAARQSARCARRSLNAPGCRPCEQLDPPFTGGFPVTTDCAAAGRSTQPWLLRPGSPRPCARPGSTWAVAAQWSEDPLPEPPVRYLRDRPRITGLLRAATGSSARAAESDHIAPRPRRDRPAASSPPRSPPFRRSTKSPSGALLNST